MTMIDVTTVAAKSAPTPVDLLPASQELSPQDLRLALDEAYGKESLDAAKAMLAEFFTQQQAPRLLIVRILAAGARMYWMQLQPRCIRDHIEFVGWLQNLPFSPLQAIMVEALRELACEYADGMVIPKNRRAVVRKSEHAVEHAKCLLACTAQLGLDWPFLIRHSAEHFGFDPNFVRQCESALHERSACMRSRRRSEQ
jgi:hypothetical protein